MKVLGNPDTIYFESSGLTYYSEKYLKLMMDRARSEGMHIGRQEPVIHRAEIIEYNGCTKPLQTLEDLKTRFEKSGFEKSGVTMQLINEILNETRNKSL